MIDKIIEAVESIPGGEWTVRTVIDDSGDYKTYSFDIYSMNVYRQSFQGDKEPPVIPKHIGCALDMPNVAVAFAGAKELALEVKRLRGILDHHRISYEVEP